MAFLADAPDAPTETELLTILQDADGGTEDGLANGQARGQTIAAQLAVRSNEGRVAVTNHDWKGPPNLLVLHDTDDYRAHDQGVDHTPEALDSRALKISVDSPRHGVLGSSACATDAAVTWLRGK